MSEHNPRMEIKFQMDIPNSCVDCRFNTIDKADRYGGWYARCLINRDLKMAVKDAIERRHEKCPGRIV